MEQREQQNTELVAHVRDLEIAGNFFIEAAKSITSTGFSADVEALGEYYLVLSITLTRGNASEDELAQVEKRTSELVSLQCVESLALKCTTIAEQILQDMKSL